ncbi:NADPH-dependent oxidoreductase [Bombiscardovia nodaiensis]|uniref:NADPH-dependent oxidoreductase n=1 Tax=Bombiscardovia nodaiensis TaxID=2932181 RepID=A0ABM8B820_9BIFI|nr:NADPH-dependent oxidoreductase [Bombiscardovia nodaiensis]
MKMTMRNSAIITTLLERRSIRRFSPEPIDPEIVETLERAAQQAPTSGYLNDWSALRITDPQFKARLAHIGEQGYIAQAPLLYVFIADEHRNISIAQAKGVDVNDPEFTINASYRFTQAQNDAVLALSAMETAANSLGLGCVVLGSLLNDVNGLIDLMHLPKYTYPVLGLAIGKPAQAPAIKPRMPRAAQFFDNTYPADDGEIMEAMKEFDQKVHHYYDLRQADRPVDAFSDQVAKKSVCQEELSKAVFPAATRQGFRLDR